MRITINIASDVEREEVVTMTVRVAIIYLEVIA